MKNPPKEGVWQKKIIDNRYVEYILFMGGWKAIVASDDSSVVIVQRAKSGAVHEWSLDHLYIGYYGRRRAMRDARAMLRILAAGDAALRRKP